MVDAVGASSFGLRGFGNLTGDGSGATTLGMRSGNFNGIGLEDTQRRFALPHPRTPLVDSAGRMAPEWWRFFEALYERKLGGSQTVSLQDVQSGLTSQQAVTDTASFNTNALHQQAVANAAALVAAVQVVQNAGLAGASNIPQIQQQANLRTYAEP